MIIQQFQILFDDPFATFTGGQTVKGKVIAKILHPVRIRGIELKFSGEARVSWSERVFVQNKQGRVESIDKPYRDHENYFENRYFVLGSPSDDMELEPGDYSYDFSMVLPKKIPGSFEGRYGHIRYTLVATLHSPQRTRPITTMCFTVAPQLDLNRIPAARDPVSLVKNKYLWFCCCKSGPITVVVSLPVRGFVPKQYIPLSVEVDNNTSKTLPAVVCFLTKEVVFMTVRPYKRTRSTKHVVADLVLGVVGPNISCTWQERMTVPQLAPSVLEGCALMHTNYSLLVKVKVPGIHSNIVMSLPITIGTVPLTRTSAAVPPPPS